MKFPSPASFQFFFFLLDDCFTAVFISYRWNNYYIRLVWSVDACPSRSLPFIRWARREYVLFVCFTWEYSRLNSSPWHHTQNTGVQWPPDTPGKMCRILAKRNRVLSCPQNIYAPNTGAVWCSILTPGPTPKRATEEQNRIERLMLAHPDTFLPN